MSQQLSVRVIRTVEEIESIRSAWTRWQKHPLSDVDFFLDLECRSPIFVRPHIILISQNGQPDAMLVAKLIHRRIPDFAMGPWRLFKPRRHVLRVLKGGLLGSLSAENCAVFLREIMTSLRQGEADLASFDDLRVDYPMYGLVTCSPNFLGRDPFPQWNLHSTVRLPRSIDEIYSQFDRKARHNIKWQAKELLSAYSGAVTVRSFREIADVGRMMQDVEEVAKKTWQRAWGTGFLGDELARLRNNFKARKGWLRTYVLYVAGRPCAFCIGTLYHDTYYTDAMGFDPHFARHSPGIFLLMKIFDDLCRNNVKQMDFPDGFQKYYKHRLGNCQWEEAFVYIFAPSLRGLSLKALRTVNGLGKEFLCHTRLLRRLGGVLRRSATPRAAIAASAQMRPSGEVR